MGNTMLSSPAGNRILQLLDAGSFVEIGGAVTARNTDFNLHETKTPSDGVITGYGVIDGNLVYVYSQDVTVLKGSIGEMHAKKIARIYDMAMKMGAPVIGLVDCAGLRLQEATDALDAFGSLYYKQAMASGVIPQITAIFGNCGGGLAAAAAMTDFTFMANGSRLFVNAPNTIHKNEVGKCDTSSVDFQIKESGMVDGSGDEETILDQIRELICMLPANNEDNDSYDECLDDLNRSCEGIENAVKDPAVVLPMISDSGIFFETKKEYAKDMVTGFIRLNGITVGAVANRCELYDEEGNTVETFDGTISGGACEKAAGFVKFCDAFGIPVLTLTNVEGWKASMNSEKKLAKAMASMIYSFVDATVPKVNVITDKAYGSAYVAMNSKSIGADIVYAWDSSKIAMMDAEMAAKIMYANADAETLKEKADEYRTLQSSPLSAAGRGYVDTIISPADTRKYLIGAFEMLFTKREDRPSKKHGTV